MDGDTVASFCSITNATPKHAEHYLAFSGGDLDTAIMLFFEAGGQLPEDQAVVGLDDDPSIVGSGTSESLPNGVEDDEQIARRLAQEWGGQTDEVRAPIAPTRQVLQDDTTFEPYGMRPSFANRFGASSDAPLARNGASQPRGVFNQAPPSTWDDRDEESILRETTGGASAQSAKSSRLARLFQPPFDIMADMDFDSARSDARGQNRWLMINLQDNSDFASQTLNRDLWKDKTVKALVQENFVFLQYTNLSEDGAQYLQFYPIDKYPHIAIIDPRTGERVKTWSEPLQAMEFISEATEFLDRFSLDEERQNPVQKKARQASKPLSSMSEEDQLNAAIMASVSGAAGAVRDEGNEARESADIKQGDSQVEAISPADAAFLKISAIERPEGPAGPGTTRVQLRLPMSRTVRRFGLDEPVQRIFEFVKASVPEAKGKKFKIVFNRSNLIEKLDCSVANAGLQNASLVVEFEETQ